MSLVHLVLRASQNIAHHKHWFAAKIINQNDQSESEVGEDPKSPKRRIEVVV
jgi:hypothetical protein